MLICIRNEWRWRLIQNLWFTLIGGGCVKGAVQFQAWQTAAYPSGWRAINVRRKLTVLLRTMDFRKCKFQRHLGSGSKWIPNGVKWTKWRIRCQHWDSGPLGYRRAGQKVYGTLWKSMCPVRFDSTVALSWRKNTCAALWQIRYLFSATWSCCWCNFSGSGADQAIESKSNYYLVWDSVIHYVIYCRLATAMFNHWFYLKQQSKRKLKKLQK